MTWGKSLISGFNMDWEEKQVTILDLPGGPGIEAGVYLNGGFCKWVRQFIGHPLNMAPDILQALESMKQSKQCVR